MEGGSAIKGSKLSEQKFHPSGFSHNFEAFLSASSLHKAALRSELECLSQSNTVEQRRFGLRHVTFHESASTIKELYSSALPPHLECCLSASSSPLRARHCLCASPSPRAAAVRSDASSTSAEWCAAREPAQGVVVVDRWALEGNVARVGCMLLEV